MELDGYGRCGIYRSLFGGSLKKIAVDLYRFIATLSAVIILAVSPEFSFAQEPSAKTLVKGHVDQIRLEKLKLTANGWACTLGDESKITGLSVRLDDLVIYEGGFETSDRPDVATSLGEQRCLASGWSLNAILPSSVATGVHSISVLALSSSGQVEKLSIAPGLEKITKRGLWSEVNMENIGVKISLLLLILGGIYVYIRAEKLARILSFGNNFSAKPSMVFGLYLLAFFAILLSMGITGSSFRLGLQQTPFVTSDAKNILWKDQGIRSDEWLVLTPLAIAQYNHKPRFPVINKNLGDDGQNMLVNGMTGTPVAHVSALAKPATWGFFLFDLKRALSWYWIFPVFSCLFAVWGVVALLVPGRWRATFLIALLFSVSPYVAAWSNWPAYTVFFPSLALLSLIAIFKEKRRFVLFSLSFIFGLSLAGFFLILYPPWQVSLAYVFMALTIGVFVRDGLHRNINQWVLLALLMSFLLAGGILWFWWVDARVAIRAMMDTVYPGQRTLLTGGEYSLSGLLRGFTNVVTLKSLNSPVSNQSEVASFFYMLLPLLFLSLMRGYQRLLGSVEIALIVIICAILCFMMVGLPVEVAKYSLWGRVPAERADLALGFSAIVLSGMLLLSRREIVADRWPLKLGAATVAIVWVGVVAVAASGMHPSLVTNLSTPVISVLTVIVALTGYFLALGYFRGFVFASLLLSVATIVKFNPINVAPTAVQMKPVIGTKEQGASAAGTRTLVLETQVPAMLILASGNEVLNGVFYYPQKSIWQRLDEKNALLNLHNRYQHLIFTGGSVENPEGYRIESPANDVVKVVLDFARFDFRTAGASFVASPAANEAALRSNPSLTYIKSEDGWCWFSLNSGAKG